MYDEIVISEEMAKKLEALPDVKLGKHFEWTPEKDAIVLQYYGIKRQVDLCELLGTTPNTLRARYRILSNDSSTI